MEYINLINAKRIKKDNNHKSILSSYQLFSLIMIRQLQENCDMPELDNLTKIITQKWHQLEHEIY